MNVTSAHYIQMLIESGMARHFYGTHIDFISGANTYNERSPRKTPMGLRRYSLT